MNKIRFYTGLAILVLIAASLEACKPDDRPPEAPKHHGPFYLGEARDYVFFKPGTWWVYENSKTKERDSIVVISMGVDTITYRSVQTTTTVTTERLWWKAQSQMDDYIYHFYLPHTPSPLVWDAQKYTENEWHFSMSKSKFGEFVGLKSVFSFPFESLRTEHPTIRRMTLSETMTLGEKTFHGVFGIEEDEVWFFKAQNKAKTRNYWAKNYGLIKREAIDLHAPDTVNWELVNAHIIK